MLILISCLFFFLVSLILVGLRIFRPEARYTWLVALGGAMLGFVSVFLWLMQLPVNIALPGVPTLDAFHSSLLFTADGVSFPFALATAGLILSILLTAVAQPVYVNTLVWAGTLALGGVGILAVTANNPLTLLLLWASLDLTELIIHLSSIHGASNNEKVVISFSARAFGIGFLLWGSMTSIAEANTFEFQSMSASAGIFLAIASGLRLGVLPLHLPYAPESNLRRGFGTALRFISAASSLILLGRIPVGVFTSSLTPILIFMTLIVALYAGWAWLRAPDELNGRPYWVIGIASLSILSALSGNPVGAVAWGCALLLVGGALFLASAQNIVLNRIMLLGAFSISALPFSLTASAWLGNINFFISLSSVAQALMMAGFIRHALRSSNRDALDNQPAWMQVMYLSGIILLILIQFFLGFFGWEGAMQIGAWMQAIVAALLTFGLVWASRRFRIFNPVRAHWVSTTESRLSNLYQGLWALYRFFHRGSQIVTTILEGEGGIMWTLLFLVLFVALITRAAS